MWPYKTFISERQFTPGVYCAEVTWDRKYYTFEPVDLTQDRPETVTFRPAKVEKVDVVYEGIVVHGVTGRPVAGAIVLHRRRGTERDVSSLTVEQWAAIRAVGPRIDATDPALRPLLSTLVHSRMPMQDAIPQPDKDRLERPVHSALRVQALQLLQRNSWLLPRTFSEPGNGWPLWCSRKTMPPDRGNGSGLKPMTKAS